MKFRLAILSIVAAGALGAAPLLQLFPTNGSVIGRPGDIVGWGFSLTNWEANFLVVGGSDFVATPVIGTYVDWIGPAFILLGPGAMVSQAFDMTVQSGIGMFTIGPGSGAMVSTGEILVFFDTYSVSPLDPLFDPLTDTISTGDIVSASAEVSVTPEPGVWLLCGGGLMALLPLRLARRRR